ncbi:hypothetical protein BV25DRAFT_1051069 [Artomyces pyxidatus]|uniref:Uncharacterized protein n=1 Tax=Artomyces pyxidatus TaxID=48021 RepID=A0ACB8SSG2_9AGAM|nr:hypothetical protein BV25DRAFT_1051069 [Artomyces pyxidatus]
MRSFTALFIALLTLSVSVSAAPVRREVPQEHSHQAILDSVQKTLSKNNPNQLKVVSALLGNKAAIRGVGKTTDPDCLQQNVADQAFTNAKAAKDVQGMVDALTFRALERNTPKVGAPSNKCTSTKAVNPEIAAIQQHQDPASPNAAAINKASTLALAKQIKAVGGNPQDAVKAGTFAPGNDDDHTEAGNSCSDANDKAGCIFTKKLLVPDATPAEIDAAVGGSSSSSASDASAADASSSSASAAASTSTASAKSSKSKASKGSSNASASKKASKKSKAAKASA